MAASDPDLSKKEIYINENLLRSASYWMSMMCILGAFLFLVFSVVDYFMSPTNFRFFLLLRSLTAISLITISGITFAINRKKVKKGVLYFLLLITTAVAAVPIEIMILRLGGPSSAYYAGLILVVISLLGFLPLSFPLSLTSAGLVYLIYIVPLLMEKSRLDAPMFINNNTFLVATMVLGLTWRFLNQKKNIEMLGLQYDLDQDKKQLETYSTDLGRLVQERTKELNKSELMFRSLFQNAQDGILIMDQKGKILDVNKVLCDIHGFDKNSLVGANIVLFETEEDESLFRERMERILSGEPLLYETRHYRKDGSKISLEVSSKVIDVDGRKLIQSFYRDVTEKKKLQTQLVHSQKMDSVGQLAGGIAHDFNNILTAILGFTELILLKEDLDEDIASKVRTIDKVARQAAQMVSKLLGFARRGHFEAVPFSVDKAIMDTLEMIGRLVPEHVTLSKQLQAPLAIAKGDVNLMDQVIMNLVINAKDAMPGGGKLTVATSIVNLREEDLDIGADVVAGEYVNILVRDTGTGIPDKDLPHIFEPFFTTKDKGKGTGLGLAMVYGIIKEHSGYITVKSRPGKGSDFNAYLPLCSKKARGEVSSLSKNPGPGPDGIGETILAIDDEAPVLQFIKETLAGRGFNVITIGDPVAGLDLFRDRHSDIRLVITDMAMPVMDGGQLAGHIKSIDPTARVIAITGYNNYRQDKNIYTIIKKPFTSGKLLATVNEALDNKGQVARDKQQGEV